MVDEFVSVMGKGVIKDLTTWSSCSVPLDLVVCRDSRHETLDEAWGILNLEYTDMALSVSEEARQKLRILIQRKKQDMRLAFLNGPAP